MMVDWIAQVEGITVIEKIAILSSSAEQPALIPDGTNNLDIRKIHIYFY